MYEMIMAYNRKKLLLFILKWSIGFYSALFIYFENHVPKAPWSCMAWFGPISQGSSFGSSSKANCVPRSPKFLRKLLKIRIMYVKSHCH